MKTDHLIRHLCQIIVAFEIPYFLFAVDLCFALNARHIQIAAMTFRLFTTGTHSHIHLQEQHDENEICISYSVTYQCHSIIPITFGILMEKNTRLLFILPFRYHSKKKAKALLTYLQQSNLIRNSTGLLKHENILNMNRNVKFDEIITTLRFFIFQSDSINIDL